MTPEAQVRRWLEDTVIGLDLCPWARPVWERGGVRLTTTRAATPTAALDAFLDEHHATAAHPACETVLLIFERWHLSFELFWEWVGIMEEHALPEWQVVAFHPGFRFEGLNAGDPANGVNRAPFAIVQWLRTADVAAATRRDPSLAEALSRRNGERLLGYPVERTPR